MKEIKNKKIIDKIIQILTIEKANKIAIFGSYARGEEKKDSDIDIIVGFSEKKSLLDLVRIERILSEALRIKVDLLTERSINPFLQDIIKKEMKVIYQ
jgi:uncharacterized protein